MWRQVSLTLNFSDSNSFQPLASTPPVLLTVQAKLCMVFVDKNILCAETTAPDVVPQICRADP